MVNCFQRNKAEIRNKFYIMNKTKYNFKLFPSCDDYGDLKKIYLNKNMQFKTRLSFLH